MSNNELNPDELNNVIGGDAVYPVPGVSCPQCNGFIPVSIVQFENASCVFCPECGYKLEINKNIIKPE